MHIEGVRWVPNSVVPTGEGQAILLAANPISTVVLRQDEAEGVYPAWGIHLCSDDELTVLRKADGSPIVIDMVDCRKGSPTLRNTLKIECHPDSSRRLVIPRGVAHLPQHLRGCLTLNSPNFYWDYRKLPMAAEVDVINVPVGTELNDFPIVPVARYPYPKLLLPFLLAKQHQRIKEVGTEFPFVRAMGDGTVLKLSRSA